MRIPRLYLSDMLRPGADLRLDAERSHYVARVLRARPGDALVLFDGRGGEHTAVIASLAKKAVTVSIEAYRDGAPEPELAIHLLQGISRGERMDWIVQKATELGAARITPLITEFSIVHLDEARAERRIAHWAKIAQAACEQCGRNRLPVIDVPQSLGGCLEADSDATRFLLHAGAAHPLSRLRTERDHIELLIGPEGGLSDGEHEQATAAGFEPRSLGPRILRTETAALAAIAIVHSRLGDLA